MIHHSLRIQICSFWFLSIFIFSCDGQGKTNTPKKNLAESELITNERPTLTKIPVSDAGANIHCSLQDKKGNLWFGTTGEGLYRFDGKSFINLTEKDGLNNNQVTAILEDKAGNIWLGTNAGLCHYDGKKFSNIQLGGSNGNYFNTGKSLDTGKNRPAKNAVWSMMQDKSGRIWFGTFDDGIYCYDGKTYTHFLYNDKVINKDGLQLKAVNSILEDKLGNIWFATWFEGLCRYDGNEIISFKPNGEVWYSFLLEDKNGDIWIGRRSKGVCRYNGKTFTNVLQHGTFDSCSVRPLAEDRVGNIWFGTMHGDITKRKNSGGLWRFDGKAFKNFTTKDGMSNNSVWSIVEDKAGNLWMGTTNSGLYMYNGKSFTSFSE